VDAVHGDAVDAVRGDALFDHNTMHCMMAHCIQEMQYKRCNTRDAIQEMQYERCNTRDTIQEMQYKRYNHDLGHQIVSLV
jgi:hypothetical protein